MIPTHVKRPRNVDWKRAAAILYGDWGTSKAYVIGLAFAVAGYSSFWLIAAMCVLTALVGINYMTISLGLCVSQLIATCDLSSTSPSAGTSRTQPIPGAKYLYST